MVILIFFQLASLACAEDKQLLEDERGLFQMIYSGRPQLKLLFCAASLLKKKIKTFPCICYSSGKYTPAFIPVSMNHKMQFYFIWKEKHYTLTVPLKGYIVFLTLRHNLVQIGLDLLCYT